ncbi:MAG TPA: DUF2269 family protein [Candidatus Eisenbacteria bacterium]|nr:DUF2269 family protein [Candidatus Eisenbacteria bacterium]
MYLVLKLLHVASVIAFLGNITTGLFWHRHAARTRDPKILAHVMDGIIQSDRIFTIPGVIGITVAGFCAAIVGEIPLLRTPWVFWSIVLFSISGIVFSIRLAPIQRQLRDMARAGATSGAFDMERYHALTRRWEFWGAIALGAPLGAFILMVLKPT